MFVITSITMLRERTTGTLERLMSLPLSKLDLLLGYGLAFGARRRGAGHGHRRGRVRAARPRRGGIDRRRRRCSRSANALLGMALGLLRERVRADGVPGGAVHAGVRAAAVPALRPARRARPDGPALEWISYALPLTWAYDGLQRAVDGGDAAAHRARCGNRLRGDPARAGARRRDAAPPDAVTQISVIGSGVEHETRAEEVGRLLAERGATVVCGGLGEVMAAAARGAKSAGGTTSGSSPASRAPKPTNDRPRRRHRHRPCAEPCGRASGDAVIAVGGRWGTLAEIGFARALGRYVVILEPGLEVEGVPRAGTPEEAVKLALAGIK